MSIFAGLAIGGWEKRKGLAGEVGEMAVLTCLKLRYGLG